MSARLLWHVVAFLVLALNLLRGQPFLTSWLVAAGFFGIAWLPSGYWRRRWSWVKVPAVLLACGHPPMVMAMIEARAWQGAVVWWPTLLQCWGMVGIGWCVLAGLERWWAYGARWWLRLGVCALALVVAGVAITPLPLMYRWHISYIDDAYPEGQRFAVQRGSQIALDTLFIPVANPRGVVVFTQGVGRWKEHYRAHLDFFRAQGWSVLCYDLRGHGRSSSAMTTYGVNEVDDLLAEWVEAKRLAAGRPVVAYGVSMGAAVTLLAAHRLDGCGGVIAESPYAELSSLLDRRLRPPANWIGRIACRLSGWDPDSVRPIDAPILTSGCPLLLGWAGRDTVVPPEHGERLAAAAPRARRVFAPEDRHTQMLSDSPEWRAAVAELMNAAAARP